ncbi:hypothetical protein WG915_02960 [Corynebacterium sp. H128]|uniref:hypothetical protein n=1 Tax=unclassified Corynebacterium TaxID=2624378 RepID=UPI0030B55FB7
MTGPQRPARRRIQRPTDAENIDRTWDSAEAAAVFTGSGEAVDPKDPKQADDFVVILDEGPTDEDETGALDEEFWQQQRPPHFGQ